MRTIFSITLIFVSVTGALADQPITPEEQKSRPGGLSPRASFEAMIVADDLAIDQLLHEPVVKQPVFLNFDERGRLWVVQYIQYPHPAGLNIVSRDQYWRNVYDKVPAAPPNHVRGKDKITIHEDTDGDGKLDSHKVFIDGLNMVTSVEHGRGGHWVLNPPYLLFYADRNRDDIPDGDPVVHLSGFGLEDSHSFANSLRWGPDGWLYGAQGSTVTANIIRPGLDEKPIYSQGQNIWRYHPETRAYEIFAEGGGNAFGVEIDSVGRIFSGHNGGNTRGFHYPQGGYLRKGFTKHGPLSNPYAFGFFPGMPHHDVERFTHNFLVYDSGGLPAQYHGKLFGVEPLQGRVVVADFEPFGSSFRTSDISRPVRSDDDWFRPVDIKLGPDGAIYLCDWYDGQVGHYLNHEGNIDPRNGRIYRLHANDAQPLGRFDLGAATNDELVDLLAHENRWFRQTALRVLADRKDATIIPNLKSILQTDDGQSALEALWAMNQVSGLDSATAELALGHSNPHVRVWGIRLLGDARNASHNSSISRLAREEPDVEVRQQIAAYARRVDEGLPVIEALLTRDEDADDVYQPLMVWWALETHCRRSPDRVIQWLGENSSLWSHRLVQETILHRLMQRFAMEGTRSDLLRCAALLSYAADTQSRDTLLEGFEEAFRAKALSGLPDELVEQIARSGGGSLALRVRQADAAAINEALTVIQDADRRLEERVALIRLCSELSIVGLPAVLTTIIDDDGVPSDLRQESVAALQSYNDDAIADMLIRRYAEFETSEQKVVQSVLSSRVGWTKKMLRGVEDEMIDPLSISIDVLRNCTLFDEPDVQRQIESRWGDISGASTEKMKADTARFTRLLNSQTGDPYLGQKLFQANCGKCHKLFIHGGDIGPDLTTYKRDDITNMVLNVVNPNAEIREGFENYMVLTEDGRVITGLMVERDSEVVVLRTAEGLTVTIDRDSIEESRVLGRSLMPEGLLTHLTDREISDLFAYLRSTQPLNN